MRIALIASVVTLLHSALLAQSYRAGVASIVITPEQPMWAAGYGSRTQPNEGKVHDLFAKALVLDDDRGGKLVFVTSDLLGFPKAMADHMASAIADRHGLTRAQICLTSSHTHCGPVLEDALVDLYPLGPDQRAKVTTYSRELERKVIEVVANAFADLAPATVAHGQGTCAFAMNRRENKEGEIFKDDKLIEGYTVKGPFDHDVPVLRITSPEGRLRAIVFGYACHCTTMAFEQWCGDYAGFAQDNLERDHPGAKALFFAGCGGDQNPLPRRKLELCRNYGRQLSTSVDTVLKSDMTALKGTIRTAFKVIELPLDTLPTRAQLEQESEKGGDYEKRRAARLLKEMDAGKPLISHYPYPVQAVRMGDFTAVVLGGEVVVDYALRLKRELGPRTCIVAYANDVMAYIPSRRVLAEGGYEGKSSMAVYGLPTTWAPEVEEQVITAAHEVTAKVRRDE